MLFVFHICYKTISNYCMIRTGDTSKSVTQCSIDCFKSSFCVCFIAIHFIQF